MKYMKQLGIVLAIVLTITGCANKVKDTKDSEDMQDKGQKTEDMQEDKKQDTMSDDDMADDKKMDDDAMKDDANNDEMKDSANEDTMEVEVKNKGKEAADFTLTDINGDTHTLADYKGKKIYLKFWASWCSICLSGLSEGDELAGADNDFEVLTIVSPGFSGEKNTEKFTEWFNGLGMKNMNVLFDEGGDIAKAYGIRGYPTSVYIGSDGILVKKLPGHNSNEKITESFDAIY